jgi:hypothetical protein
VKNFETGEIEEEFMRKMILFGILWLTIVDLAFKVRPKRLGSITKSM